MTSSTTKPLKIYLCDLTHDTVVLVTDTIPINIGFLAAYAKNIYGDQIDISLFKYPGDAIDAIKAAPPDVLGLSNYCWNSHLSEQVASIGKQANPNLVTVQGGTNFPVDHSQQRDFLLTRPATDVHIDLEGEIVFSTLVGRALEARDGGQRLFDNPIDGCVFIEPSTRHSENPVAVRGQRPERIRNLDEIPSPYLTGILDKFFDGRLTAFLETNRGCPFSCTFCHTGQDYFQKSNMFSIERVQAEIDYIAPRISASGIATLHLADTNFGMFPRDRQICETLRAVYDKYHWPQQIMSTTGKNNKERVIDITSIMGNIFSVNMSVQSMDENVLHNIKRDNIKLDDFLKVNAHLNDLGRTTKGELIMAMPGETKESFLRGVEDMVEANVSYVCIYTLMLLTGTAFKDPGYRTEFGIEGKYRVVPLNFGDYGGEKILDCEEVGIQTKDMAFDDYIYLRGFALMVESLHNGRPFEEMFWYALALGVRRTEMLRRIYDHLDQAPVEVQGLVNDFFQETRDELWDTEEELLAHYKIDENYEALRRGDVGGNLIYKYKSLSLAFMADHWIDFLAGICKDIAKEKLTAEDEIARAEDQIDLLSRFCQVKLSGLLDPDGDVSEQIIESDFDITGWLTGPEGIMLDGYACASPVQYGLYYADEQLELRDRLFKRYGTELGSISKIVTRIPSLEAIIRKVRTPEGEQVIYSDTSGDRLTRYTMAN